MANDGFTLKYFLLHCPLCRMYLEVLGNTLVTEDTAAWVRKTAARLADRMEAQVTNQRAPCAHVTRPWAAIGQGAAGGWDPALLRDKEREGMAAVFKQWARGTPGLGDTWTARTQKLLGGHGLACKTC